jgi:hypothetical protein
MRRRVEPLLCELHAHTRWSDGSLDLPDLVDLYGRNGFDVLAVTDHVVRSDDPWQPGDGTLLGVHSVNYGVYLAAIDAEAARARRDYDLLLLPGLELTYNDPDPYLAAHAVAVGCRTFVGVDTGVEATLAHARREGAALIAAHPYVSSMPDQSPGRETYRFSRDWSELQELVDRWELFNRYELFSWVAQQRLRAVACGDFHEPGHLFGWKTMLPCAKDEEAVVAYLRSSRPAFLTRVDDGIVTQAA